MQLHSKYMSLRKNDMFLWLFLRVRSKHLYSLEETSAKTFVNVIKGIILGIRLLPPWPFPSVSPYQISTGCFHPGLINLALLFTNGQQHDAHFSSCNEKYIMDILWGIPDNFSV